MPTLTLNLTLGRTVGTNIIVSDTKITASVVIGGALVPGPRGLPGDKGEQGIPGVAKEYTHTQGVASSEWIANHNLGTLPAITITTLDGVEMDADVKHASVNQAILSFAVAVAGKARCA